MRKLFLFPAILLSGLIVFQSCSKQSPDDMVAAKPVNTAGDIISATIANNQTYQVNLANSGDVTINKQASHFKVSLTELDTKSGFLVYKYVPAADYLGNDEVILSMTKTLKSMSGGCSTGSHSNSAEMTSYSTTYTTIKINITK